MSGDKIYATRVRAEANERLDLVDFNALALTPQNADDALTRALMSTPQATAGAIIGERWSGSVTANPTSGSDGLVRVDSAAFVGVDSNGGLIIKPNGTALSVAIPGGGSNYQVYLYAADVSEDTEVRRKLPATGPFTEFVVAIDTALRQTVNLYIRAGSAGSSVPDDAIGTVTYSLLLLGIASNTGGVVTFTPSANMLETVTLPTMPTASTGTTTGGTTVTGSGSTVRNLINTALYLIGQGFWKGSAALTPAAGNNFGAYTVPSYGIQKIIEMFAGSILLNIVATTGDVAIGGNLGVIGFVTTNQYYKQPNQLFPFGIDACDLIGTTVTGSGVVTQTTGIGGVVVAGGSGSCVAYFKVPILNSRQRLNSLTLYGGSATNATIVTLYKYDESSATYVAVTGATGSFTVGPTSLTLTPSSPTTVAGTIYVLMINCGTGTTFTVKKGEILADTP